MDGLYALHLFQTLANNKKQTTSEPRVSVRVSMAPERRRIHRTVLWFDALGCVWILGWILYRDGSFSSWSLASCDCRALAVLMDDGKGRRPDPTIPHFSPLSPNIQHPQPGDRGGGAEWTDAKLATIARSVLVLLRQPDRSIRVHRQQQNIIVITRPIPCNHTLGQDRQSD